LSLLCDFIIFVNTGWEHRVSRGKISRHWQEGEVERRERYQMSLEEKRKRSDYVIDNNFTEENTYRQINEFWQIYLGKN
ncbi:MAG: dephospho-CoA kinase, partial [Candidatus Brocadia sp.]